MERVERNTKERFEKMIRRETRERQERNPRKGGEKERETKRKTLEIEILR